MRCLVRVARRRGRGACRRKTTPIFAISKHCYSNADHEILDNAAAIINSQSDRYCK